MSTTVTGSPPRGQPGGHTAPHRRGPGVQTAPQARRRFRLPRASTTPGKFWLVRSGLVIVCLACGALATLMVSAGQSVFASNAAAGSGAFDGLEAGIIALAAIMAVGCGWGLTRRLAEYR
ncbi:MAG: hypothetical protein ACRDOD_25130 [Streptosporangiaceae bacterium]